MSNTPVPLYSFFVTSDELVYQTKAASVSQPLPIQYTCSFVQLVSLCTKPRHMTTSSHAQYKVLPITPRVLVEAVCRISFNCIVKVMSFMLVNCKLKRTVLII